MVQMMGLQIGSLVSRRSIIGQRKYLPPGTGKSQDEQTCKNNHGLTGMFSALRVAAVQGEMANGSEDHKANEHPGSPEDEGVAAAKMLYHVQAKECGPEVDTTKNHLSDEAVVDAGSLENNRTVVEEVVGTCQLLQCLEADTKKDPVSHSRCCKHFIPGLVCVQCLGIKLLLDLLELACNLDMVLRNSIKLRHSLSRFIGSAMSVGVARTFREEDNADTQNQNPEERDPHRNSPRSGVGPLLSSEVNAVRDENAERDE
jgi:hypothetical protein